MPHYQQLYYTVQILCGHVMGPPPHYIKVLSPVPLVTPTLKLPVPLASCICGMSGGIDGVKTLSLCHTPLPPSSVHVSITQPVPTDCTYNSVTIGSHLYPHMGSPYSTCCGVRITYLPVLHFSPSSTVVLTDRRLVTWLLALPITAHTVHVSGVIQLSCPHTPGTQTSPDVHLHVAGDTLIQWRYHCHWHKCDTLAHWHGGDIDTSRTSKLVWSELPSDPMCLTTAPLPACRYYRQWTPTSVTMLLSLASQLSTPHSLPAPGTLIYLTYTTLSVHTWQPINTSNHRTISPWIHMMTPNPIIPFPTSLTHSPCSHWCTHIDVWYCHQSPPTQYRDWCHIYTVPHITPSGTHNHVAEDVMDVMWVVTGATWWESKVGK